jgi:glutathione-regulated potassium-efflux system ancillary protein KefC
MELESGLKVAATVLLAACVAVPLAQRARMSSVLGYLVAGTILGPAVLGVISNPQDVLHISEFGVVLFMFLIGLELNLGKLWSMRGQILGLGSLQVFSCALVFAGVFWAVGFSPLASAVAGFGFALSSTAVALQILGERNLLPSPSGKLGFSVLLYQDLVVIPVLVALPLLTLSKAPLVGAATAAGSAAPWWSTALGVLAVTACIGLGRLFIRPVFRWIAATNTREIFTAFSLLIIAGVSVGMHSIGLSMALGSFVAGVLLSDSEYRHELEAHIQPFKGLLLGLFFLSVGMSIDFAVISSNIGLVIGLLIAVVLVKLALIGGALRLYGLPAVDAVFTAATLSQVGEFAFVLFGLAGYLGMLDARQVSICSGVVALSMLSTSVLVVGVDRWVRTVKGNKPEVVYDQVDDHEPEVIIAGFGRFGQICARLLHASGVRTTLIDHSADVVQSVRRFKIKAYYGDASRRDLLEAAGIARAKVFVIAIDDQERATLLAAEVRAHFPKVKVIARAYDLLHAYDLLDVGVDSLERETFDAAVAAGRRVLRELGFGAYQVEQSAQRFKQHDVETMLRLHQTRKNEAEYLTRALEARDEIDRMLAADREDDIARGSPAW